MRLESYDCALCGRDTNPMFDPSPCEDHSGGVGPCCAPCQDCRDDAAEQAAMDERRGL
jgi:hypothetical protein